MDGRARRRQPGDAARRQAGRGERAVDQRAAGLVRDPACSANESRGDCVSQHARDSFRRRFVRPDGGGLLDVVDPDDALDPSQPTPGRVAPARADRRRRHRGGRRPHLRAARSPRSVCAPSLPTTRATPAGIGAGPPNATGPTTRERCGRGCSVRTSTRAAEAGMPARRCGRRECSPTSPTGGSARCPRPPTATRPTTDRVARSRRGRSRRCCERTALQGCRKNTRARRQEEPLMQLGMIGLGRMGANMVLRLMRARPRLRRVRREPRCRRRNWRSEGAAGADDLDDVRRQARTAAQRLGHGARRVRRLDHRRPRQAARPGRHDHRRRQQLLPRRHPPRRRARGRRHPLCRRRHERRRLRARPRLLPDDRRRR